MFFACPSIKQMLLLCVNFGLEQENKIDTKLLTFDWYHYYIVIFMFTTNSGEKKIFLQL